MNFAWMTNRIDTAATFWLLGMVLPATIALGAITFMWRRGWLLVLQAQLADADPPHGDRSYSSNASGGGQAHMRLRSP